MVTEDDAVPVERTHGRPIPLPFLVENAGEQATSSSPFGHVGWSDHVDDDYAPWGERLLRHSGRLKSCQKQSRRRRRRWMLVGYILMAPLALLPGFMMMALRSR
jgi:hypothetical protein